jgi:hypothetical protein
MTSWTDDEVGGTVWSDDESGAADGSLTGSEVDVDADKVRVIDATDNRPKLVTVEELLMNTESFTQSGSGASARTVQAKLRDWVSVKDFGAVGDGTTDDTSAIQACISAVGSGTVYFPAGTYKVTSTLTVGTTAVHLRGAGKQATKVKFAPTANDTLISVTAGASTLDYGSIRDITLYSEDSTYTKVALELIDITRYEVENVAINGNVTANFANMWSGANSVGINTKGRDSALFKNVFIAADRPLIISANPNHTIDVDHFQFTNFYPIANGHPCVEIEDGVIVTHLIFDGYQPWVGGTYGLYWSDTTTASVSYGLQIENLQTEQTESSSGYDIYIVSNAGLQTLTVTNMLGDSAHNGIYLRNVHRATFIEWQYGGTNEAFNADGANVRSLHFIGCNVQTGSTATMTSLYEKMRVHRHLSGSPIGDTSFWTNQSTTTKLLIPALSVTDSSQFDDDTVVKAVAATTSTTVGAKNARVLVQNDTGTVNAGGEVVFMATSDTDVERYAAIGTDVQANSGSGATGDVYIANKAATTDATLLRRLIVKVAGQIIANATRFQEAQGAALTAANNLTLGSDGNYFQVDGATQINLILNTNWQGGSVVTLKFNSTPTVKHNQAASGNFKPILLAGAADLVASANDTLTLRYDSTDSCWYEMSRAVI